MIKILLAAFALTLAASPSFACPWSTTSSIETPSTTAAVQPTAPAACPTCVVPDQGATPHAVPSVQKPS